MLSYRHAFHAGNHADVLKHTVLVHLLRYLTQKDKPLWFIDTHAGAAAYALDEGYATKKAEYESGIGRLWARDDLPQPVADYVEQVRALNPDGALRRYPGSPQLALQLLRKQDRLRMFELHSTESRLLQQYFRGDAPRAIVQAGDGFAGLQAVLPPPSRRALVLIDPSYEDKGDYRQVLKALRDAQKRFRAGVYAVWYPQVAAPRVAPVSRAVESPAGEGLAARYPHGEEARGERLRPAWQRHVHTEPALAAAQGPGPRHAVSGQGSGAGCRCDFQR